MEIISSFVTILLIIWALCVNAGLAQFLIALIAILMVAVVLLFNRTKSIFPSYQKLYLMRNFLLILSSTAVLLAVVFLLLQIHDNYINKQDLPQSTELVNFFQGANSEGISNDTLLAVISLLLAFAGALSFMFKTIIEQNIESKLNKKELIIDEKIRMNSIYEKARNSSNKAYLLETIYTLELSQSKCRVNAAVEYLKLAIFEDKNVIKLIPEFEHGVIDGEKNGQAIVYFLKNNFVYRFTALYKERLRQKCGAHLDGNCQNLRSPQTLVNPIEINNEDMGRARKFVLDIEDLLRDREKMEVLKIGSLLEIYQYEETCIWFWYWLGNKEERKKAFYSFLNLRNKYPEFPIDSYEKMLKLYENGDLEKEYEKIKKSA